MGIPQQQVQIPQREINPPNPTFAPAIKEEEPEESLSSFSGFDFRAPCHVENVPQLVNGFVHPHPPSNSEDGGSYNGLLQQMVNGFAAHQQPAEGLTLIMNKKIVEYLSICSMFR